jgi:integrase
MRRRYQGGSVTKSTDGRYWLGKWRGPDGRHRCKLLGKIREMSKSKAKEDLTLLLRSVNAAVEGVGPTVNAFLKETYFPLFSRKWKPSTLGTNQDRINREIGGAFGSRTLASLSREELQTFLDGRSGLSFSTAAHLRWDLKQMFDLAASEGLVTKNPAIMLFVPKGCPKPTRLKMSIQEVRLAIGGLELRERLIFKLATVAGMRPGEIFGLRRARVIDQVVDIQQGIYRRKIGTPKTEKSVRQVAIAATLREDIDAWLTSSLGGADAWLFPSERLTTPISKDNHMSRFMRPALQKLGLGWINYQVMRRTHASLMRDLGVNPKVVADLMGHDLDVNLNIYTQTSMESRREAAETLESALVN